MILGPKYLIRKFKFIYSVGNELLIAPSRAKPQYEI
jgi:hypothetical protein